MREGSDRGTTRIRELVAEGDGVVAAARVVRDAPSALRRRASAELEAASSEQVDARLGRTPLSSLRETAGTAARLGTLTHAGVSTVADVLRLGRSGIAAVKGAGPTTAAGVWAAAGAMRTAVAADTRFRFEADAATPAQTRLLATLVALGHAEAGRREVGPRLNGLADELAELTEASRPATLGWRFWWFSRRARRETALGAVDALQDLLATPSTRAAQAELAEVGAAIRPESHGASAVWDRYRRDAASINALLASLDVGAEDADDSVRGFVDPEVDAAVERTELDRRHLRAATVLRNYQVFGARYLLSRERAILGDEMGLGKTLQALTLIAHLAARADTPRFLVICPAAVLVNWLNEIDKHTTVTAHSLHGAGRDEAARSWVRGGGIAVTTIQTLGRLPADIREARPALVVVDEAHQIKNPGTKGAQTVRSVLAGTRRAVFLTGTPMENRVEEFRTLVSYLDPAIARRVSAHDALGGARAFRRAVSDVYLRRNQDDVLPELPERIETESWVHPTVDDAAAYRAAVSTGGLGALTRMRLAAWLAADSAKLGRLRQIVDEAAQDGLKVLVFSEFLHVLDRVENEVPHVVGRVSGSVAPAERERLVAEFSGRDGHAVLVAQILAGGVGLNIQAASVVVLAEPHWKPGVEEQAVARAHRMGQTRRVQVHRLLAKATVDERVREIQQGKRDLFDAFARRSHAKEADAAATDTGVERALVAAERARLGPG